LIRICRLFCSIKHMVYNFFGAERWSLIRNIFKNWLIYSKEQWSNGKSVGRDGQPVNYETGTIIWENPELMRNMFFPINSSRNEVNPFWFHWFCKAIIWRWRASW
jgi:glucose-6-phosphate isomerase